MSFRILLPLILVILALLVSWLFFLPAGLLITPDSLEYIFAARSLSRGGFYSIDHLGMLRPMTAFPPLYPLLLAAINIRDPMEAAKWLNLGCFCITLSTIYFIALRRLGSASSILLLIALTVNPLLLELNTAIASEAVFLALLTAFFAALFLETRWPAVLTLSALPITRYAGLFFLAAWSVLAKSKSRKLILLAFLPAAAWGIRNMLSTVSPLNRSSYFHPPTAAEFFGIFDAVGEMLVGQVDFAWYFGVAVALALVVCVRSSRFSRYAAVYLSLLLVSKVFLDAEISLNARILSPLFICFIFLTIEKGRALKPTLVNVLLLAAIVSGALCCSRIFLRPQNALFNQLVATAIPKLSGLESRELLASNGHDLIRVFLNQRCLNIPSKVIAHTRTENPNFDEEIRRLKEELGSSGRVVWFKRLRFRWYLPAMDELINRGFAVAMDDEEYTLLAPVSGTVKQNID